MNLDYLAILRAVFESTADGLLLVDNSGKVLDFNKRFQELWRIPPLVLNTHDDEIILNHILDQLLYPEKFIAKVKELYHNPEAISHDQIEFKDGRFFERYSRPLKVGENSIGRIWSFRDVTELKKNQEIFSTITDLSPDIICILSIEGKIKYISKATVHLHGFFPDELVGTMFIERVHPDDKKLFQERLKKFMDEPLSLQTIQYRYLNEDKTYSWMEITGHNQIKNPLINGIVAISRVITDRKNLEENLRNALRLRDDFISIASHELKTPIASIKLQLQMMERSQESSSKAGNLSNLLNQFHSLQALIEDLLSVTKIRTGQLSVHPSRENLSLLVRSIVDKFKYLFSESGTPLELSVEDDLFMDCDAMRIEQVITNLISNALKYAPGTLMVISLKRHKDSIELQVSDHGPGIGPDQHKIIFECFERSAETSKTQGLGLGLFISKNIVEAHGGTLQLVSEKGQGASFIVKLPATDQ
jgi:PAS domain S-box-containing protein